MRVFKIVGSVALMLLAILFCAPLGIQVWVSFFAVSGGTDHIVTLVSPGSGSGFTLSGWQLWTFVTVLAALGGTLAVWALQVLRGHDDSY